jgi:leader peptidase (prepilin peptidase)/N-methyltransferase
VSAALLLTHGWTGLALAIWTGLCVGSFLNVVIYRLPEMLNRQWRAEAAAFLQGDGAAPAPPEAPFNLLLPRSHCPHCGHGIRAAENIPILSWLVLRGRCSQCRTPIPVRYPLVEACTAIASLLVLASFGYTSFGLAALLFTWTLLALAWIDYDTQLLPDPMTLPLLWLGLVVSVFGGLVEPTTAIIGAAAGYGFLWLTYWGFKLVTGKEGMGYGDFKLLGAIGAWLGWQVLPAVLLIAAATGLVYALWTMQLGRRQVGQPVPFGPFLATAGWIALLEHDRMINLFLVGSLP